MRTSYCRGCGAEILFFRTETGKTTPVDAEPVPFKKDGHGPEMFLMADGTACRGRRCDAFEADQTGHISHFATCPNAESFRKKRKSDRKRGEG